MKLTVVHEDLFAAPADALVVSIDGAVPASEPVERVLGNVGRQLVRRFPEQNVLDQIESQLDLPLSLGRAQCFECEGLPYRWLALVSTLHHTGAHDDREKLALVARAFSAALASASRAGARSVRTTVLQGGWRLSALEAFGAMLSALDDRVELDLVTVCCLDAGLAESLAAHARSVGFRALTFG